MGRIDARRLVEHPCAPALAACLLVALAYANAPGGGFVFDDLFLVRDAPHIRSLSGVASMLGGIGEKEGIGYRPVRTLTHAIEYQLFGLRPWGYHLTNMLLHALACVLVFALGRRLGLGAAASLAGMALFAVHPVHTEAVTYISGRRDVLYSVLFLAGLLSYIGGVTGRSRPLVLLALAFYALSIFSKEMGITLPAVIYLWEVLVNRRGQPPARRLVGPLRDEPVFWAVIWAGAIAFFLFAAVFLPRTFHPAWWGGSPIANFATVLAVHGRYLAVQVLPVDLLADYSQWAFPLAPSFLDPRARAGAGILVASPALAHLVRGAGALAILSYWIVLLPVSHVFPHHELAAEHHLYLPSAAICLAAGAGIARLSRLRPWAPASLACVLVVPCIALTLARNVVWSSEYLLWSDTVARAPWCSRALLNLAAVHLDDGRIDEAAALLERSLRARDTAKGRAFLGHVHTLRGEYDLADSVMSRGLSLWPGDRHLIRFQALNLRCMGREAEARRLLARGIDLFHGDPDLHALMAGSLAMDGRPREALAEYMEALRIRPSHRRAREAAVELARSLGEEDLAAGLESGKLP